MLSLIQFRGWAREGKIHSKSGVVLTNCQKEHGVTSVGCDVTRCSGYTYSCDLIYGEETKVKNFLLSMYQYRGDEKGKMHSDRNKSYRYL